MIRALVALTALFCATAWGCGADRPAEPADTGQPTAPDPPAETETAAPAKKTKVPAEQLIALGYANTVKEDLEPGKSGVVKHDPARAYKGVTLLHGAKGSGAHRVIGMDGAELHRIRPATEETITMAWVAPAGGGQLLGYDRGWLAKLGWDGRIFWENTALTYHHDVTRAPDGTLYAPATKRRRLKQGGAQITIEDELIAVLSPDGKLRDQISVTDLLGEERVFDEWRALFGQSTPRERATKSHLEEALGVDRQGDLLHLNSIVVLDRNIGVGEKGHLLLCLRSLDLVLIVNPRTKRIVWEWAAGRELLDRPHRPVVNDRGNLVVFDNGWRRGSSRVLEVDPGTGKIAWEYPGKKGEPFYTRRGGMAQPLPGGNVLISIQDQGRAIEVTRGGDVVWDYRNTERDPKKDKRTVIYRARRWGPDQLGSIELGAASRQRLTDLGYLD